MRCHYYNITTLAVAAATHTQNVKIKRIHSTQSAMPCISGFAIPTAAAAVPYCFLFWENRAHALQMDYTLFHYTKSKRRPRMREMAIFIWQTKSDSKYFCLHFCLFNMQACVLCCTPSFSVVIVNFFTCFLMEMCNMCYEIKIPNAQTTHGNNTEHVCN